jgi:plastocyanin
VQEVLVKALTRIGVAVALVALAVGALAATGIANPPAKGKKPEKVKVCGYYFTPVKVKIKKGSKVKWKWADCGTPDSHDVYLKKAPNGVKKSKFRSQTAAAPSSFTFTKRFKKPGKYNFICSLHPTQMQMTVTVKR